MPVWDTEGRDIVSGGGIDLSLVYQTTAKIDVLNQKRVNWVFKPTNLGAVAFTDIVILAQFSTRRTPVETPGDEQDWMIVPYVDIVPATGVGTLRNFEQRAAVPGAAPFTIAFENAVQGRWMRLKFKAVGGDPTGSLSTIRAFRMLN